MILSPKYLKRILERFSERTNVLQCHSVGSRCLLIVRSAQGTCWTISVASCQNDWAATLLLSLRNPIPGNRPPCPSFVRARQTHPLDRSIIPGIRESAPNSPSERG